MYLTFGHQLPTTVNKMADSVPPTTTVIDLLVYLAPLSALTISIDASDILLNTGLSTSTTTSTATTTAAAGTTVGDLEEDGNVPMQVAALAAFGAAHRLVRWFWAGSWEMRSGR